jgi:hypothetical protein
VPRLLERTLNLKIDEAYPKLKAAFEDKGCKVISEEPPNRICFNQGSLWGIAPQTAKKTITVNLEPLGDKTKVKCSSKLSSDWKNITLIGCALALVLVGLCLWMATDLSTFKATLKPGFWSWLVTVGGKGNFVAAQALINLTRALAAFLSVIILLEGVIVIYARSKIDAFTEEVLKKFGYS